MSSLHSPSPAPVVTPSPAAKKLRGMNTIKITCLTPDKYDFSKSLYVALGFDVFKVNSPRDELLILHSNESQVNLHLSVAPASSSPEDVPMAPVALHFGAPDLTPVKDLLKLYKMKYDLVHIDRDAANATHENNTQFYALKTTDPNGVQLVFSNVHDMYSTSLFPDSAPLPDGHKIFSPMIKPDEKFQGKGGVSKVAILTSGGDSQGMNAAVRAAVRLALAFNIEPFGVYEGYQGLIDGGDKIRSLGWDDVRGWLSQGGTNIGTARCMGFKEKAGRLQAVTNMVKRGINALIVIGGDGSLTGANKLRAEWPDMIKELCASKTVTSEEAEKCKHLNIVGLVGSIDNDMCMTDLTIGALSSLHRICEAVDAINTTAISHSRAFVIEVMGRNCGWLALMASIATASDWLFIPEQPMLVEDWQTVFCNSLKERRERGKRNIIIILCEGAIDKDLNPIKSEQIKKLLSDRLGFDTRVTTLGHVQRGGTPCFFDRYLGTLQGAEAIYALLDSTPETPSPMIGLQENKVTRKPLMEAVKLTHDVSNAIQEKNFSKVMELRDPEFVNAYKAFMAYETKRDHICRGGERVAIIHCGAPAGGMNAATRVAVRYALSKGFTPVGVSNGFKGLSTGDMSIFNWESVSGWMSMGGSQLGTNRELPIKDIGVCAYQLQKHRIQALLVIGGFEAFSCILTLVKHRESYPAFCIPMILIPATISNNVPGTEYSLGSDTALNIIAESSDRLKQSASSSRKRLFVVEVQGGQCGYLATFGALGSGAITSYIPEEGLSLRKIQCDIDHLIMRYREDKATNEGRVIIRNDGVSRTYTTETLTQILEEESCGLFGVKSTVLGHIQQGGMPSPLDRVRAGRLAVESLDWIEQQFKLCKRNDDPTIYTTCDDSAVVIGLVRAQQVFTPVTELVDQTDFKNRRPKEAWWMSLRPLLRKLAKYEN